MTVHVVMGIERGCELNDANGASTRGALQQNVGIHESPAARSATGILLVDFFQQPVFWPVVERRRINYLASWAFFQGLSFLKSPAHAISEPPGIN